MISIQTLSETFYLPYNPELPISVQLQQHYTDYHVDFQRLVNLKTEALISDTDRLEDGDSIGLIMLNDVNVQIQEEMPVGGETFYMFQWTPSHIEYGESYEAQLGNDSITIVYDQWDENDPFFYSLSSNEIKYKRNELPAMLEQDINCNWPSVQRETLIKNLIKLLEDQL